MRQKGKNGEEGEDEHGAHTSLIGVHSFLFHEIGGKPASDDGEHRDGIEDEDEQLCHRGVRGQVVDIAQVGGGPEQEEPPDAVGQEFAHGECPCLFVADALQERHLGQVFSL